MNYKNSCKKTYSRLSCIMLIAIGAFCLDLLVERGAYAMDDQAKPVFSEFSCKKEGKMNKHILVAYGSRSGSTSGVAEAIGKELCDMGASVDVRLIDNVKDVNV
jgi:hypothetical protein